jgi:hypothetical protein
VQGALTIVGLDGVTQFTEALEALLEAVERRSSRATQRTSSWHDGAMASLRHYLDDLIGGQPNQPCACCPFIENCRRHADKNVFWRPISSSPTCAYAHHVVTQ